jgi:hypothetical protein
VPTKDDVTLTLAHPLGATYAERLGLEAKEHPVGDKITVSRDRARAIIDAGYAAGVDPGDPAAVASALKLPGAKPASGTTNGGGSAAAAGSTTS